MKKVLSTLSFAVALSIPINADIVKVEMGAGAWTQKPKGSAYYNGSNTIGGSDALNEDKDTSPYIWAFIKHPIPIIPNIRLEYTSVSQKGKATGQWEGSTISVGTTSQSTLDIKQYDIIPYYNLLDNTFWMTLDLGIDVKMIDFDYKIEQMTGFSGYAYQTIVPIPMAYLRARVEIPVTNIALEADAKYVGYGESHFYDARVKVDFTLNIFPTVQPALEVGYRVQKIKIDESTVDVRTDIDFAGMYAGLMLRF